MNSTLPEPILELLGITRCRRSSSGICHLHTTGIMLSGISEQPYSLKLLSILECRYCLQAITVEFSGLLVHSTPPSGMSKSRRRLLRELASRLTEHGYIEKLLHYRRGVLGSWINLAKTIPSLKRGSEQSSNTGREP